MCGIVGYIGNDDATPLLYEGLTRLEYRGYDSAGIAVVSGGKIEVIKVEGRLERLKELIGDVHGRIGIGHTRWATHGEPKAYNSHPHLSQSGRFAIVHNGIIENYSALRSFLVDRGFSFVSQTDSEVIAHLIDFYYTGDAVEAILRATKRLIGSYALGIVCRDTDELYAIKKDSPLVVGLNESENYIASDMQALIGKTNRFYIMDSGEIAVLGRERVTLLDQNGNKISKDIYTARRETEQAEKNGYPHYMLKEIHEQPAVLQLTLDKQLDAPLEFLDDVDSIHIIGCGSAYHAALMGKYIIESLTGMRVNADIASEFRYRHPIIKKNDLLLAISQSGETADTIGAMKLGKSCKTACIVNVPESSLTHIASPMYTFAGPEIAVATTKGFTTQLLDLYIIALRLLLKKSDKLSDPLLEELNSIPQLVRETLLLEPELKRLGTMIAPHDYAFFIGRGADYAAAKESALKLKEISYIHADCYPAGELKHGTISLIEKGSVVVAIATDRSLLDKTISNIIEVKSRGAVVIGISSFDLDKVCDFNIKVPQTRFVSPLLASVACQLLAYYTASARGCDIDKPRNLAKSVTVE